MSALPVGDRRKVVFVNRFFYPDESATSQMLTDLAVHLAASGLKVVVLTGRYRMRDSAALPARDHHAGAEIRRVWTPTPRGKPLVQKIIQFVAFYPAALIELLRLLSPGDVVVTKTDPPLISVIGLIAARVKRAQLVNWVQDLYPEVAIALGVPMLRGPLGKLLAWCRDRSLAGAIANVAIGDRMAEKIAERAGPGARVSVIPNWADDHCIAGKPPSESEARAAWGFAADDFVLGYSGNLGKAHEAETLLSAAKLLEDHREIKFLFIGGGRESERLKDAVSARGLASFTFKPHQPRDCLPDTIAAPDAHWLSLRPELEGLIVPSKLYGILAAGRPLIAVTSKQGDVAQVVQANGCGLVVEPGDAQGLAEAILRLSNDRALRLSMGTRGRILSQTLLSRRASFERWTQLLGPLMHQDRKLARG